MQASLRFPLIMLLALLLGVALVPARAGAQTPPTRSMTVNQVIRAPAGPPCAST